MTPLLLIIGSSGSGKSTLARELASRGHVRLLPTWTTRPPRPDEMADGHCPEHRFVDEDEFARMERSGCFLATGDLRGLGHRYGLPLLPAPAPGLVDAVIVRAPYVERVRAVAGRPVLVYQVESDAEASRSRVAARGLPSAEVEARTVEAEGELAVGRALADRVFVNSGPELALTAAVVGALRRDAALDLRDGWVTVPRSRWHWVGTAVACLVAVAGLAFLAFAIVFVVGMSQWGSNK